LIRLVVQMLETKSNTQQSDLLVGGELYTFSVEVDIAPVRLIPPRVRDGRVTVLGRVPS
jgi:hypothetical protein